MGQKSERLSKLGLRNNVLRASALLLSGVAISGCGGCLGKEVTAQEARQEATEKYQDAYNRASPAGKFVLQYLRSTKVTVPKYPDQSSLGWMARDNESLYLARLNNACLKKTAYDIAGGSIKGSFSGLFTSGSISGDVPTAAAYAQIDNNDKDVLLVQSGHANSQDLRFTGLQKAKELAAADDQTENILNTYGCESGLLGIEEYKYAIVESSSYIK